jgi:uncharacterized cupredoxin-like copper-binding protein
VTPRLRSTTALAVAGLFVVAGCGEKRETTTGAAAPAGGSTVTIMESEYKLTPPNAEAAKGGQVQIQVKNEGGTEHALEIEAPGGEVKSKTLSPGDSQTLTANLKPGTYEMYCPIDGHKGKGMVGKLVVGAGGAAPGPSDKGGSGGSGDDSGGGGYSRGGSY